VSNGRRRGIAAVAITLMTALVTLLAALLRRPSPAPTPPTTLAPVAQAQPSANGSGPRRGAGRWFALLLALLSGTLTAALTLDYDVSLYLKILVGTATVAITAFGVRGPRFRYPAAALVVFGPSLVLGLAMVFTAILLTADPEDGDISVLVVSALCAITVVAAIAWSLSTWHVGAWLEPTALVVTAALLGGISLLGLYSAGTTIARADVDGSGELFLSAPRTDATLEVYAPVPETPDPYVRFTITATRPVRWALVLTGAAMIRGDTLGGDRVAVSDGAPQVLTGELRTRTAEFHAHLRAPIATRSASRAVVTFPGYRSGFVSDPRSGDIAYVPRKLHITLDAGRLSGLETVTQVSPPLTGAGHLTWEADDRLDQVSYSTFDQGADDVARNKLFAVAIFLGTAAACLISAMQSVLNRRRPITE
jgi:hypothetical protein